jgi:hypothetical protein
MTSLVIPFANEEVVDLELVDSDRDDIVEQLEARRAAIEEADSLVELSADRNGDNVLTNDIIASESNHTLNILIKSILCNVKEVGYANENIEAIQITNTCALELLKGYAYLFPNDSFRAVLNELDRIASTVVSAKLTNIIDLDKIVVPISGHSDMTSIATRDDYTTESFFKALNEKKDEIGQFFNDAKEVTEGDVITTAVQEWRELDITGIVAPKAVAMAKYISNVALELTSSIAKAYNALGENIGEDHELRGVYEDLGDAYTGLCREAESKYLIGKAEAVESFLQSHLALEAFRDTTIGKILVKAFHILVAVINGIVISVLQIIMNTAQVIAKLIRKVNEVISKSGIDSKITAIKNAGNYSFSLHQLKDSFYIQMAGIDNHIRYYRVGTGVFGASLNEITDKDPEYGEVFTGAARGDAMFFRIDKLENMMKSFNPTCRVPGLVMNDEKNTKLITLALPAILSDYRDAISDYLKKGDIKKLIDKVKILPKVVLETPIELTEYDIDEDIKAFKKLNTESQTLARNPILAGRSFDENEFISCGKEVSSFCNSMKSLCGSVFSRTPPVMTRAELNIVKIATGNGSYVIGNVSKAVKSMEKMINEFELDGEQKQRAVIAKAALDYVDNPLKILVLTAKNTIDSYVMKEKMLARGKLICIRVINKLYKELESKGKKQGDNGSTTDASNNTDVEVVD